MPQNLVRQASGTAKAKSSALAALAAVATRLGVDTSVDQLRRRFSVEGGEPDTGDAHCHGAGIGTAS